MNTPETPAAPRNTEEQLVGEGFMLFDAGKPTGALFPDDCGSIHKQPWLCTCSVCRARYDREIRAVRIFANARIDRPEGAKETP